MTFFRSLKNEIMLLRGLTYYRVFVKPKSENEIVERFHRLYYDYRIFGGTWVKTFWCGVPTEKCPLDLWIYQEIIWEQKPDVIVECGTKYGGSALFMASILDLLHNGNVVTIDIDNKPERPKHERIVYLHGSSTSMQIVRSVESLIREDNKVMVILDSDHTKGHVIEEMRNYSKLVTKGSYLIVEDTNLNGHPVTPNFGPGPMEAVEEFLRENTDFIVDEDKGRKFLLTFNPKGYLRKI